MAEHRSRLSYLDADNIDDDRVDFDGLDVLDPAGNKLGNLDGFMVDAAGGRPYYAVVDSGGWFSGRRYLLPIGHARLDAGNKALRVDVERGAIEHYPEFDESRFSELSEEDSRLFAERTLTACCGTELQSRTGADRYDYDKWSHYAQPDWWRATWYSGRTATPSAGTRVATPGGATYDVPPVAPVHPERDVVVARDRGIIADRDLDDDRLEGTRLAEADRREAAERAQPGDVLGIENEGQTTTLGDSAADEHERLRDAEESAPPLRPEDRKR